MQVTSVQKLSVQFPHFTGDERTSAHFNQDVCAYLVLAVDGWWGLSGAHPSQQLCCVLRRVCCADELWPNVLKLQYLHTLVTEHIQRCRGGSSRTPTSHAFPGSCTIKRYRSLSMGRNGGASSRQLQHQAGSQQSQRPAPPGLARAKV